MEGIWMPAVLYLSIITTHILLALVLINVPPTSYLRAFLLPILLVPTLITVLTAKHASPVVPFNLTVGVGYGPRLALEIFDLVCISKAFYPSNTTNGVGNTRLPWHIRAVDASRWALDVILNKRRIGYPDQNKYVGVLKVKNNPYQWPSRHRFLMFRFVRFVLGYMFLDLLSSQSLDDMDIKFGPGQERILSRILTGKLSAVDFGEITGTIIGFGICGSLLLIICHDFVSLVAVGSGISPAADWPPLFGPVLEAYSLRRFWSVVWHQQIRSLVENISFFVTHTILHIPEPTKQQLDHDMNTLDRVIARYSKIQVAFLVSGILHLPIDRMQGIGFDHSGIVTFFSLQALGVFMEDIVCTMYRRTRASPASEHPPALWQRVAGYLWLYLWMFWCLPCWIFPALRKGPMAAVPYSILSQVNPQH
ncbi:hypothetical protein FQN57_001476 [Myotisia sp. PD_48]|nr:hypothetical protein FQN57_001476 [Myotisia sp. PD_48]